MVSHVTLRAESVPGGERNEMYSSVMSGTIFGIQGMVIQVEADMSEGLPGVHLVGSLSREVQESGERIRTALRNSGFYLPPKRIVISLSPADVRKTGSGFDLPIAIAALISMNQILQELVADTLFLGELGLNGDVLPVDGVLPVADAAYAAGCSRIVVPVANRAEAALIPGLAVVGIRSLQEGIAWLQSGKAYPETGASAETVRESGAEGAQSVSADWNFRNLKGQPMVRRAMEIAACGMHNLIMTGPPGAGKTMAAKCLTGILPELSYEESMEITKIYSVRGLLPTENGLIRRRPFRAPHHTITTSALIGGGLVPKPGEISLAHNGVLFLDELPEFSRTAIEVLRQPLEDGRVIIGRLNNTYQFPARFMLVAAMNPCPCGCYPDRSRCRCTPGQIQNYQGRISRAILDRMDLCLSIRPVSYDEMTDRGQWEASEVIRERVQSVHALQRERYRNSNTRFNSQLTQEELRQYCCLGAEEEAFMKQVYEQQKLSGRGYNRLLKLARTIADMEGSEQIRLRHLEEAVVYRMVDAVQMGGNGYV